ncbi:MAG: hypothetical protein J6R83_02210, partial [Clostridia bacterium]|nr:hypothetical protein [Clostridia bacterium]
MKIQSLNGWWDYRVLGGRQKKIKVPFSSLAVGRFYCEKTFSLKYNSDKIFIKFDRITYQANVTLNGKFLGVLGPYAEYFFDVTDIVKKCDNRIVVEVFDLTPKFGPSEGWENYGGIIGDVSVLFRGDTYIDDVTFTSTLKNNYQDANYSLKITHGGVKQGHYAVKLIFKGKAVDSFTVPVGEDLVDKEVKNVSLWSPDTPTLYTLKIDLIVDGKILDSYQEKVGFREFTCNRHRFLLNGQEVFLHGVCRHEMILDYGHTVPYKLVKKDLIRIKSLGCNYVRLVHYPHNKKTLELCDSIGLMTSEEPGLWWSNTADKDVADGSLDVLRRTIKRDKNHPSVIMWSMANEPDARSDEAVEFFCELQKHTKKCDSSRPITYVAY